MPPTLNPLVDRAKAVLRGAPAEPEGLLALARGLARGGRFRYAREVLARARRMQFYDPALAVEIGQEHALCTHKDPDLPAQDRYERALQILEDIAVPTLNQTDNQRTLGLAGAVHKRMWEVNGRRDHLELSLYYYRRGYERFRAGIEAYRGGDPDARHDYGYTGINAALVLDLLAAQEQATAEEAGAASESAVRRRLEARRIRRHLVETLPTLPEPATGWSWWFLVTVAEAYFGLGDYREARRWLARARALGNDDWEFASTARQLAQLALLHERVGGLPEREEQEAREPDEGSGGWRALRAFVGDVDAVRTAFSGKVGLALSGGGFRASLFHIGVLAKLAELDLLRHVEALSCVSGGAIIGAHYYLEVRNLLQRTPDAEITRADYVALVERIARDFLRGVQRNIRTRVAASLTANLKLLFRRTYSRTIRIGELYEAELYARIDDGEGDRPRWLNDLFIHPAGEEAPFNPRDGNWRRRNKVPVLILNATTLNTGHNWQFTASWMGEPPSAIDTEIDGNYRLRRMYYREAPEAHRRVRLGEAVGSSSCVPGLFDPLALGGLYPEITVRLVDGGVHDNQGIVGLLDQDCRVMLVSDASGQMGTEDRPKRLFGVLPRTNSILMARVREAEYDDLRARLRAGLLSGLMFLHLKKDLDVASVDWIDTDDPYYGGEESPPDPAALTGFGIRKDVQARLAAVRTDLDSFSDAEAFALMTSGYRMAEHEIGQRIAGFPLSDDPPHAWPFLAVEPLMTRPGRNDRFDRLLAAAGSTTFKIWKLLPSKTLRLAGVVLAVGLSLAVLGALVWGGWTLVDLLGLATPPTVLALKIVLVPVALAAFGWLVSRLHLLIFDRLYLRWGADLMSGV